MLILGFVALVQTIFLPGLLILYFFKIKTQSVIQKNVYIFALSLFADYSLVTILVLFKIYISALMLSIIFIEIILTIFLILKKRILIAEDSDLTVLYKSIFIQNSFAVKSLLVGSLTIILFYFSLLISNIGTIFYFTDTVNNVHWNTWALDFANNILPIQSSHFPQLIPSNWSTSSLLIRGWNILFFA